MPAAAARALRGAFFGAWVLALPAASAQPFATEADVGQWVTNYYKAPDPTRVPEALAAAGKLGMLGPRKWGSSFIGFLSGVLGKQPALTDAVVARMEELGEQDRSMVVVAIWHSGHPDTKRISASLAEKYPAIRPTAEALSVQPRSLFERPLDKEGWLLNALWGNFTATGDEAPVVYLISALLWSESKDLGKIMAVDASRQSLVWWGARHPRVLEICRAQARTQPRLVAEQLAVLVKEAEAKAGAK